MRARKCTAKRGMRHVRKGGRSRYGSERKKGEGHPFKRVEIAEDRGYFAFRTEKEDRVRRSLWWLGWLEKSKVKIPVAVPKSIQRMSRRDLSRVLRARFPNLT